MKTNKVLGTVMALGIGFMIGQAPGLTTSAHNGPPAPPRQAWPPAAVWHTEANEVITHTLADHCGFYVQVVDQNDGIVVRVNDPFAGNSPHRYTEGPLWSDQAAWMEAQAVYAEVGCDHVSYTRGIVTQPWAEGR